MKKRILNLMAVTLLALTLFAGAVAPAHAYAPPSGEDEAIVYAERVRIYYRTRADGVQEMRIWSLTQGRWLTDWVPVDP